jgi:hypothetical protein
VFLRPSLIGLRWRLFFSFLVFEFFGFVSFWLFFVGGLTPRTVLRAVGSGINCHTNCSILTCRGGLGNYGGPQLSCHLQTSLVKRNSFWSRAKHSRQKQIILVKSKSFLSRPKHSRQKQNTCFYNRSDFVIISTCNKLNNLAQN